MIVKIKSQEAEAMRRAGKLTYDTMMHLAPFVKPGVTTKELDEIAYAYVTSHGGKPGFLHLYGFPASICASIDEEVVHGIPSPERVLKEGQLLSVDFGACVDGFHGDMARTFPVGAVTREKERLMRVTEESFFAGAAEIRAGINLQKVSKAIQDFVEARGFSVVRELTGHGIGRKLHEDPAVPNFDNGVSIVLRAGMTLAIEPMVAMGSPKVFIDGWDVVITKDKSPSSHYENTVMVTDTGYEILTMGSPSPYNSVTGAV